jgi:hypothetical protein
MEDYSISFRKTKGQPWLNGLTAFPAQRLAAAKFDNEMKKLLFEVFAFVSRSRAKNRAAAIALVLGSAFCRRILIHPRDG